MRLSDTVLVGFEQWPGACRRTSRHLHGGAATDSRHARRRRGDADTRRSVLRLSRAAHRRAGDGGFAECRRSTAASDCCDSGVSRHPGHRESCRAAASRPPTRRAAPRRSVIVNETMARGVWPGADRDRQVHPAWIRSFVQSVDRRRPARAADDGAMPRGRRHRARRASAVGRARRRSKIGSCSITCRSHRSQARRRASLKALAFRACSSGRRVPAETLVASIRRAVVDGRADLPFVEVRPYFDLPGASDAARGAWGRRCWRPFASTGSSSSPAWVCSPSSHMPSPSAGVRWRFVWPSGRGRAGLMAMVLREAAYMAAGGVLCGGALAILGGRWMQSMLVGTAPADPVVLAAAGGLMIGVAMLATIVPARSATRANPTDLLKAE